jgi:DNA-binding transcriptional regulator YiaG
MKTCARCESDRIVAITMDDNIDACGHTFTAQVPAEKCQACGQIIVQGDDIKRFELRVAVELAKAGIRDKEAFRFLRNALQLEPEGLAHILDVPEDFIGYWESGSWPVDPRANAVLGALLLAKLEQRPCALDCLAVLREPRRLGRKVRLHLVDALGQAAKALQSGSAANAAPALA